MSDNSEKCPVCKNELKEHKVKNYIDCIEKLMKEKNSSDINSSNVEIQCFGKIQNALKLIEEMEQIIGKQRRIDRFVRHDFSRR